jgi:hypothetical protein
MLAAVVLTLSAGVMTLVSGLVIPLVTGLVTKLEASTGTKSVVTVLLSVAAGVGQTLVAEGGVLTSQTVTNIVVTLGLALGAFYGIYSPFNTDEKLAPNAGIGPSSNG